MGEQDHRTIKKRNRPMLDFKSFVSASATLKEIEVANVIRRTKSRLDSVPLPNLRHWRPSELKEKFAKLPRAQGQQPFHTTKPHYPVSKPAL